METQENRFPIQVVARRTGLTPDVIRVWERRYGAVTPQRAERGRRLYSDEDVERLRLLRQATAGGYRIGDIANLPLSALEELTGTAGSGAPTVGAARGDPLAACLDAVERMDPIRLRSALNEAAVAYSTRALLDQVVVPLMREIGRRWRDGELRISHEHVASPVVASFLSGVLSTSNMTGSGPTVIFTTPAGQHHELGALVAAIVAASEGWNVVYLGPSTPASEIAAAAVARNARAVALSISCGDEAEPVAEELGRLRAQLPEAIALLVGGNAADQYRARLQEMGVAVVEDANNLPEALDRLRA